MSMKELEYPFDAGWILSNRRKIRKELLASGTSFIEKRIAVLGGSTTSAIVQVLDLFLLNQGIKAVFYESEYGKYYEDACFSNETLESFRPDLIYIHTTNRNVTAYPGLSDPEQEIQALLDEARTLLDTPSVPRNGYYAFILTSCAPTFRLYGRFADADELEEAAQRIYQS